MIGPISYIGGKNRLAKQIIAVMPKHTTYVEAFAGGAQVFFHKTPSAVEVLNDLDGEVVNFFKVCQWHHEELIRFLKFWPSARKLHDWMSNASPPQLTDVQRAARFLYLQKTSWGGLIVKQAFHYGVIQRPNYNPGRIPQAIGQTHERLRDVQIECLPYHEILKRYDRPTTLFYLDPPYWERKLYKFNFTEQDFIALEKRLHNIKGKFILSLDDHPEVRRLFQDWHIRRLDLIYTALSKPGKKYGEVLISNFDTAAISAPSPAETKKKADSS